MLAISVIAGFFSCREPTQITIEVTTDAGCPADPMTIPRLTDVIIVTGKKITLASEDELIPNAQTQQCEPGAAEPEPNSPMDQTAALIGTLVLLPEGDDPSVDVLVVAGVSKGENDEDSMSAGACAALVNRKESVEGKPCIVARRRLTFVDHNSLRLPIDLDKRCIGEECGEDLTCYQGNCVSPDIQCTDGSTDCNPPQGCDRECELESQSGSATCVDGECVPSPVCEPDECAANCPDGVRGMCSDAEICFCPVCDEDECDEVCEGSGRCEAGSCICEGCFEETCEAKPCDNRSGHFECLGDPPDDQCACITDEPCVPSECDAFCGGTGAGQIGECDPPGLEPGCYCSCDDNQCTADCGGTCDGNSCGCVTCSPQECDEQLGACPSIGHVHACDPGCVCECTEAECDSDCQLMGRTGGSCSNNSCTCDDNPNGGGGMGGSGGTPNGGFGGTGGGIVSNGGGGFGGTPTGGGGQGGQGGSPGCCNPGPDCDVVVGAVQGCFMNNCICECDAAECTADRGPTCMGPGVTPTCVGATPNTSCQCFCSNADCSADCRTMGRDTGSCDFEGPNGQCTCNDFPGGGGTGGVGGAGGAGGVGGGPSGGGGMGQGSCPSPTGYSSLIACTNNCPSDCAPCVGTCTQIAQFSFMCNCTP